jgi:hypothetical protein
MVNAVFGIDLPTEKERNSITKTLKEIQIDSIYGNFEGH